MKRGQRKFVCADCKATQLVHWTERLHSGRLRCLNCGSLSLDAATAEGADDLRKGTPDLRPRVNDESAQLISELVDLLSSADEEMRLRAVKALGKLGKVALDAVPAITERLQDQDLDVAKAARTALKRIEDA